MRCTKCKVAEASLTLGALCEPCFRDVEVRPLLEREKLLMNQLAAVTTGRIAAESRILAANGHKFVNGNVNRWKCANCPKHFSYYGELQTHEKECLPKPPKGSPKARVQVIGGDF